MNNAMKNPTARKSAKAQKLGRVLNFMIARSAHK